MATKTKAAKTAKKKPINWTPAYHVLKAGEGGPGGAMSVGILQSAGIPARTAHSCYVGHILIEVPKKDVRRACRLLR